MNYGGKLTRFSSPSPRARGEGRDEGLYRRIRTRGETPHPNPLRASFACLDPAKSGAREQIAASISILSLAKAPYGGRSRAAIQASARYAASIRASNPTTVRLPP